jgi:hypothetical protein
MSKLDQYIAEGERIAKRTAAKKEFSAFQSQLNKDLKKIKAKLEKLPREAFPIEKQEEVLRDAAEPLLASAIAKAPIMRDRSKVTISISGRKYIYYPGNLKASIQEIVFKRRNKRALRAALFFGPRVTKKRGKGGKVRSFG